MKCFGKRTSLSSEQNSRPRLLTKSKPNEVGLILRGGAAEWLSFWPWPEAKDMKLATTMYLENWTLFFIMMQLWEGNRRKLLIRVITISQSKTSFGRACIILIRESISQYWTFLITKVEAKEAKLPVPHKIKAQRSGFDFERRSKGACAVFAVRRKRSKADFATTRSS